MRQANLLPGFLVAALVAWSATGFPLRTEISVEPAPVTLAIL
jgi:hypothetical protein